MHIKIELYGDMKKYAPGDKTQFKLTIAPGATFKDLLSLFSIPDTGYVALVNGRRIDKDFSFAEGDILVLFPEISGG